MKSLLIVLGAALLLSACKAATTTQMNTTMSSPETASGEQAVSETALESSIETDTVLQAPELSSDDELPALSAELNATGIVEENFE